MDFIVSVLGYLVPFLVVLTALVFVHELGHFLLARWNGVRVEVFSIGFGPELFGWQDKKGTRWRFALIPIGGYVKMFGDLDAASAVKKDMAKLPARERAQAFPCKKLWQRALIVAAGPVANYLLAVVILAGLYIFSGFNFTPAVVSTVQENSVAAMAGVLPGDRIVEIDGAPVTRFNEVQRFVQMNAGQPMHLVLERAGARLEKTVTPEMKEVEGAPGGLPVLGVMSTEVETRKIPVHEALWRAAWRTVEISQDTLTAVGQIFVGTRGTEELGGPIKIAQLSRDMANGGFYSFLYFMAVLSVNLGLINLFPVPVLDGGHLMFYGVEALFGRPLNERAQNIGAMVGLGLVLMLMVFVTWNDLTQLKFFDFLGGLIG